MKIITIIARVLLGIGFVIFGANLIHPFLPMPNEKPPELVAEFMDVVMMKTAYMKIVGGFQLVGGLLLLVGRFVPVGLALLGPVLVNILMFHTLVMQGGYMIPLVFAALWLVVFAGYRSAFAGVFKP